jgi:two-component system phosphate regulon sensor histidine kinase PhoR
MKKKRMMQMLMGISLLLLLIFLIFWLKKEYQEQRTLLVKDSNILFKEVVSEVRDSLLFFDLKQKAMLFDARADSLQQKQRFSFFQHSGVNSSITIEADTLIQFERPNNRPDPFDGYKKDSVFIVQTNPFRKDSQAANISLKNRIDRMDVRVASEDDNQSKKILVKALSFAMKEFSTGDSVTIQIGPDSLPTERLYTLFSDTLARAHQNLPFTIHRIKANDKIPPLPGILTNTFQGDYSQKNQYFAQLEGFQWYLAQKIAPQILFSLFLFSITAFSFFLVYRSWQNQSRLTEIKNDFISNITHELKTPITTVGVALEALSDFEVLDNPQKTQEYLGISQNELKRLNLLVDKVLQMSKFEKQVPQLKIERIDLQQTIEQIASSMKLQFEKHAAKFEVSTTGNNFQLEGDRSHLSSVLYNLIDNALKYSKDHPHIQIHLKDIGDRLLLEVKDNGLGIPKAYQEKIFDKFFRIPSGDRHNVKGHGLGLSYVAGIVEQHHGSIRVESVEGGGSCFYIALPKFQSIV